VISQPSEVHTIAKITMQNSLAFRSFTFDAEGTVLFTRDITGKRRPAYSIQQRRLSNQTEVSRISGPNWNPTIGKVGCFRLHNTSSRIDIDLHGHAFQIRRQGRWRPKQVIEWPPLGVLEWKEKARGQELHMIDDTGRTLARCVANSGLVGERTGQIDILVPGDDRFVDMCVVTSLARWREQDMSMLAALTTTVA
jgi:hypothetical protein